MNSIVERLRDYQESWGDSIKRMDCGEFGDNGIMSQIRAEQHATWKEAADMIESQERRIKELEAELASIAEGVKISVPTQTMEQEFQNHYRRGYEAGKAALRQRIDGVESENARLKRQYQQATGRQPYEPDIDIDDGC